MSDDDEKSQEINEEKTINQKEKKNNRFIYPFNNSNRINKKRKRRNKMYM